MRVLGPKRIVLAAASFTCLLIFLFAFFLHDVNNTDGKSQTIKWRPSFIKGSHRKSELHDWAVSKNENFQVLASLRNKMGFYNRIDAKPTGHQIMNPTLLQLPPGAEHDFLVIARAPHIDKEINGKKYRLAQQVAFFANLGYDKHRMPQLEATEWSKVLLSDFAGPEHHCKHQPGMDKYIGPEDMKLFWTREGAPLIIFTYQVDDENLCQGMFIVDARAAVPELLPELGSYAKDMPAIRFEEPVGLRRQAPEGEEASPRYQREKNWALTQSDFSHDADDLMFMVEPGKLYRYKSENEPVEDIGSKQESAVQEPYPPNIDADEETWHSDQATCVHDVMLSNNHVHQSTPMLSVTLCNRGQCTPTANNTVMIGMLQRRYDPPGVQSTWYDRHIAVYNSEAPYNMISVSKTLTYYGEGSKYIWTGSMVYIKKDKRYYFDRSHGYLDDEIWLSFGIGDAAPGWMDVKARDLVSGHYLCQDASKGIQERMNQISPKES